jgi:hypothetical protein
MEIQIARILSLSLSAAKHNRALCPELVAILDSAIGVRIIA